MILDWIRFGVSAVCTLFGLFVLISGVVGVYRYHTALTRIHCAAISDTVGIFSMMLGVIAALGFTVTSLKCVLVVLFLWMTSPVASHLIARLEVIDSVRLEDEIEILDKEMVDRERKAD